MSQRRKVAGPVLVLVTAVAAGCTHYAPQSPSPVTLDVGPKAIPPTGLCTVVQGREGSLPRSCEGIELAAPAGARILFRPDDGTRHVAACYLSEDESRRLIGIDVFDVDTREMVRVLQSYGQDPPAATCREAYFVGMAR